MKMISIINMRAIKEHGKLSITKTWTSAIFGHLFKLFKLAVWNPKISSVSSDRYKSGSSFSRQNNITKPNYVAVPHLTRFHTSPIMLRSHTSQGSNH